MDFINLCIPCFSYKLKRKYCLKTSALYKGHVLTSDLESCCNRSKTGGQVTCENLVKQVLDWKIPPQRHTVSQKKSSKMPVLDFQNWKLPPPIAVRNLNTPVNETISLETSTFITNDAFWQVTWRDVETRQKGCQVTCWNLGFGRCLFERSQRKDTQ